MKLSFIIVHYRVPQLLENCLRSIYTFTKNLDFEVIVIDNFSPDSDWKRTHEKFPEAIFLANGKNEGFSKANNKAAKLANGEYLFFLNPDTELLGDYINEILLFADRQENLGAIGLRMEDAEGKFLPESKRRVPDWHSSFSKLFFSFKNPRRKSYYRHDIPENAVAETEVVTGANLLIKKTVFEKIGGFDERYFMYGEDIDLCYSLLQMNLKNFYYGKHTILHLKGQSTEKNEEYLQRFYGAMQIFIDKYYKTDKPLQHSVLTTGLRLKKQLALAKKSGLKNVFKPQVFNDF